MEKKEKLQRWKLTQPQWVQDIWNINPEEYHKNDKRFKTGENK